MIRKLYIVENEFTVLIGAIYSIVSLFACVAPTATFQLYGIIPVPAWLLVTGLFSYDLYSTLSNKVRDKSLNTRKFWTDPYPFITERDNRHRGSR